ncbi:hypothetical protein Pfo_027465 [Paulownia fortunei]|nr:hypothetical protein Pfo_027465 [Paulownia fortunei]
MVIKYPFSLAKKDFFFFKKNFLRSTLNAKALLIFLLSLLESVEFNHCCLVDQNSRTIYFFEIVRRGFANIAVIN